MEDQWHESLAVYHDTIGEEIELLQALAAVRRRRAIAIGAMCETGATHDDVAAEIKKSRQYVGQQVAAAYRYVQESTQAA